MINILMNQKAEAKTFFTELLKMLGLSIYLLSTSVFGVGISFVDKILFILLPRSLSVLFDRSFFYSASKLWNVLPLNLRTASSLNEFKSCLRNYLERH